MEQTVAEMNRHQAERVEAACQRVLAHLCGNADAFLARCEQVSIAWTTRPAGSAPPRGW